MKRYTVLAALLLCAVFAYQARADFGFGQNYIQIDDGSATWYDLKGGTALDNFEGNNFGSFTSSDTLSISGYEGDTYKNSGDNVTDVDTWYRVYKQGEAAGAFSALAHGWTSDQPFTDAAGNSYSTAGDQKWAQPDGGTPSLLSGLSSSGTYVIEVFQAVRAEWGGGSGYKVSYNGTDNEYHGSEQTSVADPWQATFSYTADGGAAPEPTSIALIGVGTLGMFLFRRRRK